MWGRSCRVLTRVNLKAARPPVRAWRSRVSASAQPPPLPSLPRNLRTSPPTPCLGDSGGRRAVPCVARRPSPGLGLSAASVPAVTECSSLRHTSAISARRRCPLPPAGRRFLRFACRVGQAPYLVARRGVWWWWWEPGLSGVSCALGEPDAATDANPIPGADVRVVGTSHRHDSDIRAGRGMSESRAPELLLQAPELRRATRHVTGAARHNLDDYS